MMMEGSLGKPEKNRTETDEKAFTKKEGTNSICRVNARRREGAGGRKAVEEKVLEMGRLCSKEISPSAWRGGKLIVV